MPISQLLAADRIVLLVDSSTSVGPMINTFRDALNAFVDAVPDEHEVTFISTGGQIRVRTPPTTDRVKMQTEIARFASDGGANAFLDTMIEADRRFLKTAPGQWPVLVIVTTDNGETRREMDTLTGFRILDRQAVSDDEVILLVFAEGDEGDVWKMRM